MVRSRLARGESYHVRRYTNHRMIAGGAGCDSSRCRPGARRRGPSRRPLWPEPDRSTRAACASFAALGLACACACHAARPAGREDPPPQAGPQTTRPAAATRSRRCGARAPRKQGALRRRVASWIRRAGRPRLPEALVAAARAERERRAARRPPPVVGDHQQDPRQAMPRGSSRSRLRRRPRRAGAASGGSTPSQNARSTGASAPWRSGSAGATPRRGRTQLEKEAAGWRRRFYAEDDPYVRDGQIKPEWDRVLDLLEAGPARRRGGRGSRRRHSWRRGGGREPARAGCARAWSWNRSRTPQPPLRPIPESRRSSSEGRAIPARHEQAAPFLHRNLGLPDERARQPAAWPGSSCSRACCRHARPEEADLILLNSCSVREKAEQKVYSRLGEYRLLKHERPGLVIGLCGCVAQQEGERALAGCPSSTSCSGPARVGELRDGAAAPRGRRAGRGDRASRRTATTTSTPSPATAPTRGW